MVSFTREPKWYCRFGVAVLTLGCLPFAVLGQTGSPILTSVTNAASYAPGVVSPGEIVIIFGSSMGPASLVMGQLDQSGNVAKTLSGVQVLFNGAAVPLVYVSASQIAAIVPYAIASVPTSTVQVVYQSVTSNSLAATSRSAVPGIFTANASGTGQGAIANSDGSFNSSVHPALPGSYITFYLTGVGQTNPPGSDGAIATGIANLLLPVSVTIGGQPAPLLYAGAAPGGVDGFAQINAVVPSGLATGGNLSLIVQVGGFFSQPGVTVAVSGVSVPRTLVVVHGLNQGSADIASLSQALSNSVYGVDLSRFTIDSSFDWSTCAKQSFCPSYCSLEEGATELANHIASLPRGHIILVGYSMGGLLSRDLILNNRNQILSTHPVDALVTLGTPNVGYPGESIDSLAFCTNLVTEMSSDWRSQQATNQVLESTYLYQLNTAWTTQTLPTPNLPWLAVAGTFCSNPIRDAVVNTGCRDSSPYNDGLVCADSASFNLSGRNLPTSRWSSPLYAHTNDARLNFITPTGCNVLNFTPLDAPQLDLTQKLASFINGQ